MASPTAEEKWLTLADAHKLYTKSWSPSTPPTARLLLVHGFSDHCNAYDTLINYLTSQAIKVYSYDQRGFGRTVQSNKERGVTGPTQQVFSDLTEVIQSLPTEENSLPLFLLGHSMGGGIVLSYAANGPREVVSQIRGFLVEAPLIALPENARPWKITVTLGTLASKIMPHRQLVQKLDSKFMSRDPNVCREWADDALCHDTTTLEGAAAMLDRGASLLENRTVVKEGLGEDGKTRIWVGQGTSDAVVSFDKCREWFEGLKVEDKELRVYEGWYHKLHAEPGQDKIRFAQDVSKWIMDRTDRNETSDDPAAAKPRL